MRHRITSRLFGLTVALLMAAVPLGGQAPQTQAASPQQLWENLKTLRVGEKIQVIDQKLGSHSGTVIDASETELSFQTEQQVITLPREDVYRVTSLERGHGRVLHALIGLAIGAGVGAALGAQEKGNPDWPAGAEGAGIMAAPLGGIGAAVGAAIPPRRPTIYQAERR